LFATATEIGKSNMAALKPEMYPRFITDISDIIIAQNAARNIIVMAVYVETRKMDPADKCEKIC
jgi:hypothetical protein